MALTKVTGIVLPFEKNLLSKNGGEYIGLYQGGTVKDAVKYVTPQMFGAKGDFNDVTETGTDDTLAFRKAIAVAITLNYARVVVPVAKYLITDSLNLGGVNYNGREGVALDGENWINTVLNFKVPSADAACVEIRGGSGIHTGRYISGLTIMPTKSTRYTGVGYRIAGACFVKNGQFMIRQFGTNLHLLNDTSAGYFTEFNSFNGSRIHRGLVNILMETNGGDNSFHGNDFHQTMLTVKTTVAGDDGDTRPGVGIELRGVTNTVYWYNAECNFHLFGGAGAIAIKLTRANTDHLYGNMVAEGDFILQSTDASAFEVHGGFYSIGPVRFDCAVEPTARASTFIFDNRISNASDFRSPSMVGMRPALLNPSLVDRTDNGSSPVVFRALGTNIDNIAHAVTGQTGANHLFGYIPPSSNLQGFVPSFRMSYNGGVFGSYSDSFIITNTTTGIQIKNNMFSPQNNNVVSLGDGSFKWTQVYATNSTISTSDSRHKSDPEMMKKAEIDAFYEIGQLPWIWTWLNKEQDDARLHAGPTVQAAIEIMKKHQLDWSQYSAFCYDSWEKIDEHIDESTGELIPEVPAGDLYSFRKEELILLILRSTIEKQQEIMSRLEKLEK